MNVNNILFGLGLAVALTSCGNLNSGKGSDMHNSKLSIDWEGTYMGTSSCTDCSGMFNIVAIDSVNYQIVSKCIGKNVTTYTHGKIQWNADGDSIKLGSFSYKVIEGALVNDADTLHFYSTDIAIHPMYYTQIMMDNKTGNQATLVTSYDTKGSNATFRFNNKTYNMSLNRKNVEVEEYINGVDTLRMNMAKDKHSKDLQPLFIHGKEKYYFVSIAPSNEIFVTKDKGVPSSYDITYYNYNGESSVMLLSSSYRDCYILPQTEVSAKVAVYSKDGVSWNAGIDNFVLRKSDKEYIYTLPIK